MALNLTHTTSNVPPIEHGDAGLVIKADGTVQMFNFFGAVSAGDFTPAQIETGERLMALMVALQVPSVMDTLKLMAKDPRVVGASTH